MGITPSRYYFLQVRMQYIKGLFYSGIVLQSLSIHHASFFAFVYCCARQLSGPVIWEPTMKVCISFVIWNPEMLMEVTEENIQVFLLKLMRMCVGF